MTQEKELTQQEFLEAFNKLSEGEKQAARLEKMLDSLEAKMDAILKQAQETTEAAESASDGHLNTVSSSNESGSAA